MGHGVNYLFLLLSLVSFSIITQSPDDCVHTAYVRTGTISKGGKDSTMSLTLSDSGGNSSHMVDLWVQVTITMSGNLDICSEEVGVWMGLFAN